MAIQGAKRQGVEKTRAWIEEAKVPYPVLIDPEAAYYERLDLPAGPYPVVFLLDAEGRVIWIGATDRAVFAKACAARLAKLLGTPEEGKAGSEDAPR